MPDGVENPVAIQPVDPAVAVTRRRKTAPLDPRRSPGGLSADAPPDALPDVASGATPSDPAARGGAATDDAAGARRHWSGRIACSSWKTARQCLGAATRIERRRFATTPRRRFNRLNCHRIFSAVGHIHQTWG